MSNVFNDVVELDSGNGNITLLKGIGARSDVGFLSLFEHYNVCQVLGHRALETKGPGSLGLERRKAGKGKLHSGFQTWSEFGPVSITEGLGRNSTWLPLSFSMKFPPKASRCHVLGKVVSKGLLGI